MLDNVRMAKHCITVCVAEDFCPVCSTFQSNRYVNTKKSQPSGNKTSICAPLFFPCFHPDVLPLPACSYSCLHICMCKASQMWSHLYILTKRAVRVNPEPSLRLTSSLSWHTWVHTLHSTYNCTHMQSDTKTYAHACIELTDVCAGIACMHDGQACLTSREKPTAPERTVTVHLCTPLLLLLYTDPSVQLLSFL